MHQHQTAESVEAEAARVRMQLVEVGADIRAHADPTFILDAARASFSKRSREVPAYLRRNASPIGLVLLGGAVGATFIGLAARPRKSTGETEPSVSSRGDVRTPQRKARLEAALLSTVSVGLGYVGGLFVPNTPTEQRLLGEPKAVLSARLDAFLNQHTHAMRMAAAKLFGASQISAAMLVALAAAAETLGVPRRAGRKPL